MPPPGPSPSRGEGEGGGDKAFFMQLRGKEVRHILTILIGCLKIGAMKNLSVIAKRTFLVVGVIIATMFTSAPAGAAQDRATFGINGSDLSLSSGTGLSIPLSELFSLDLNLSAVPTSSSSTNERQLGAPPIPVSKSPGSDLHYTRLGVGFSFKF